ncbi:MAG: hypothetical protein JWO06_2581 [Bacteroidota bacterium]|nr:hypothetical protein [Bacteroidota bacterium]
MFSTLAPAVLSELFVYEDFGIYFYPEFVNLKIRTMKKIIVGTFFTMLFSVAFIQNNYAQDQWTQGKSRGIYSVGLGGTQVIALGSGYHALSPIGLSINVSGEYKVYKFIGVGFETGMDVFFAGGGYYYRYGYGYYGGGVGAAIGIPIGAKANVHILDAIGGISIADKLDVYAGLNIGGGPAFSTNGGPVYGFIHVGPQVGVRYWFNSSVAIFGEFGYGATFANAGVTF